MRLPFSSPDRLLAHFQRTGDPRSLGRLFDRTAPELLRVAAWLSGNRADAEDLLQRTFLTVLTVRGSYDAGRRALPWLCGILGNHCKKLHEQRARSVDARPLAGELDPAAAAADAEFAAAVARVRAELGSPYAEVLDLHLAEGLDAKRIAERLGRPAGTVRTQIVRGLQLLRRQLPTGFVVGLALTASAHAASLAAVRAVVVARASTHLAVASTASSITFGGVLMGKKFVWLAPSLLLLLGGGLWYSQQTDAASTAPAGPRPAVADLAPKRPPAAPAADLAATNPPAREAAAPNESIAAEPGFATLVVRMRWADDGSPAANVGVRALPQPDSVPHERNRLTDSAGVAVLERIRPGPCWLASGFSELERLDLAAATVRTVDLTATRTGFVAGTVVDGAQRPIADARLYLADDDGPFRGFEVGRSDSAGEFRLSIGTGTEYLGARKAGYAPSRMRRIVGVTKPILLTLAAPGGSLRGRVVDAAGRAVPNAQIEIGLKGGWVIPGSSIEEHLTQPTAPMLATNEDGEFTHDGIAVGSTEVKARAPGFGPASERVLVEQDRRAEVVLVLQPGAFVAGVVRDQAGRPAAHASVVSGDGYGREFGRLDTETDENGEYRLEGLPGGSVPLTVIARAGKASETVVTTAGATTTWNPVVRALTQLSGRVVGPDDRPVAGLSIGVLERGSPIASNSTANDAEGRFTLRGLETAQVDLSIAIDDVPLARRDGVVVGSEPLLVRLTADEVPSASLRVRVLDHDRQPIAASVLLMSVAHGVGFACLRGDDGVNRARAVPAGSYTATVTAPGCGDVPLGPLLLRANEECVLPDVVLEPAGQVEIRLAGGAPQNAYLRLLRDDGENGGWLSFDGEIARREVAPGLYRAVAQIGDGTASLPIRVRSKATTSATLTLTRSALVRFECRFAGERPAGRVMIRVYDSGEALVETYELHMLVRRAEDTSRWENRLPPGAYRFDARADDGRTATRSLTITAVSDTPSVVFELPAR